MQTAARNAKETTKERGERETEKSREGERQHKSIVDYLS